MDRIQGWKNLKKNCSTKYDGRQQRADIALPDSRWGVEDRGAVARRNRMAQP